MAAAININQFLEHTIGVANGNMRDRITNGGFDTLTMLVKKEPKFAKKVCLWKIERVF